VFFCFFFFFSLQQAEQEAAAYYDEFVKSFESPSASQGISFVKGGKIDPKNQSQVIKDDLGDTLYQPMATSTKGQAKKVASMFDSGPAPKEATPKKKSRVLDEFMKEIKEGQEKRGKIGDERRSSDDDSTNLFIANLLLTVCLSFFACVENYLVSKEDL
jgi:hypothetical protein